MSQHVSDRIARIQALADTVNARMEDDAASTSSDTSTGDTTGGDKADQTKKTDDTKKATPSKSGSGSGSDDAPQGDDDGDGTDWKAEARKHERRAKANKDAIEKAAEDKAAADAARAEAETKTQSLLDSIAKAIGVKGDDNEPPSADKLQATIAEHQGKVTALEQTVAAKDDELAGRDRAIAAKDVELAAWRVAVKQGIDAATLMDLRSTERELAKLDPAGDDFTKQLEAVVKDIAKDNPALRVAREATATEAGIGAVGDRAAAAAAASPGTGRLRAAYST